MVLVKYRGVCFVRLLNSAFVTPSCGFHSTQLTSAIQRIETENVIKVPFHVLHYLENVKTKEAQDDDQRSYRRNKGPLIISCKEKELNHYENRVYKRFNPNLHLASHGWKKPGSSGRSFSIVAHRGNPAFSADERDVDLPKQFKLLGLDPTILNAVETLGLKNPTVIQSKTIPRLLKGANVICAAETGSGKSLAYLLPLLQNIFDFEKKYNFKPSTNSPRILVLVPTKELVHQVDGVCKVLNESGGIVFRTKALLHSEEGSITSHLKQKHQIDVGIGTPQLVCNLIAKKLLKTNCIQAVVLDEADTLLDDSFVTAVNYILSRTKIRGYDASKCQEQFEIEDTDEEDSQDNKSAHTVVDHAQLALVGATFPYEFRETLKLVIETDSFHKITTPNLHRISPHVHHKFHRVKKSEKSEFFLDLLKKTWTDKKLPPTMVFCNRYNTLKFLDIHLKEREIFGFEMLCKQTEDKERLNILNRFQSGQTRLLICSDLVSRGLDTSRAHNIINFDFPDNLSDYIHRAGRVGRLGSKPHGSRRLPTIENLVSQPWEVDLLWRLEKDVRTSSALKGVDANIKRQHVQRHEEKGIELKANEDSKQKDKLEKQTEKLKQMFPVSAYEF